MYSTYTTMDDTNPILTERVTYLALRDVFKGTFAEIRQRKVIQNTIHRHKKVKSVAELLEKYDQNAIYETMQLLLADGVFASPRKAKARFPDLFESSLDFPAKTSDLKLEAVRDEVNTSDGTAHRDDGYLSADDLGYDAITERPSSPTSSPASSRFTKPHLPVSFPFASQHKLLVHLQQLLETACYEHAVRTMPQTLQRRGWDCAEAAELNRWVELISQNPTRLYTKRTKKSLAETFEAISDVRHTAVHRLPVRAGAVADFFRQAEGFVSILGKTTTADSITHMRQEVEGTVEKLERDIRRVRARANMTLQKIEVRREELRRLEKETIADMQRADLECQIIAAKSIEVTLTLPEPGVAAAPSAEGGTMSDIGDGPDPADNEELDGYESIEVVEYDVD
ncbi:hypothetical protein PG995_012497 [Apiospora arundinis]